MTPTPTASPELPGLDNLEAQARAADQDGQHIYTNPRDSNNWRANEIWHYLASPAAVLALIALARRAQPEGEAPQAELVELLKAIRPNYGDVGSRDTDVTAQRKRIDRAIELLSDHAATLSPLCGAQHAESGKVTIYQVATDKGFAWSDVDREIYGQYAGSDYRRRIVYDAQQAAAPGIDALAFFTALEVFKKSDQGVTAGQNFIDAIDRSAPGTPEAPKGGV